VYEKRECSERMRPVAASLVVSFSRRGWLLQASELREARTRGPSSPQAESGRVHSGHSYREYSGSNRG
jgi:hypothetical protein